MPGWWEDVKFGIGLGTRGMVLLADMVEMDSLLNRDWNFPPVCNPVVGVVGAGVKTMVNVFVLQHEKLLSFLKI
jgi:hypothetical protein